MRHGDVAKVKEKTNSAADGGHGPEGLELMAELVLQGLETQSFQKQLPQDVVVVVLPQSGAQVNFTVVAQARADLAV